MVICLLLPDFLCIFPCLYLSKGQLISKSNCQAMNSSKKQTNQFVFTTKAEFTEVGIFFLLQLFARDILSMKELEIEETKPT